MFEWIMAVLFLGVGVAWLDLGRRVRRENAINRAHNVRYADYDWHRPLRMAPVRDKFVVGAIYIVIAAFYALAAVN